MLNPEPLCDPACPESFRRYCFSDRYPSCFQQALRYACLVAAASCAVILALTARSDFRFRKTLDATPLDKKPPELVSPEPFSMHAGQFPDLVWRPVSGADGYRWYLISRMDIRPLPRPTTRLGWTFRIRSPKRCRTARIPGGSHPSKRDKTVCRRSFIDFDSPGHQHLNRK